MATLLKNKGLKKLECFSKKRFKDKKESFWSKVTIIVRDVLEKGIKPAARFCIRE